MNNFIILYCISIVLTIAILFIGVKFYYKSNNKKFSLLSHLPNELLVSDNKKIIMFRTIIVAPLLLLISACLCLVFINVLPLYKTQIFLFVGLILLGVVSFGLLYFLTTNNIKLYLMFFVLLIVMGLMSFAITGYLGFISLTDKTLLEIDIKKIIIACISIILFIFNFALIIKTFNGSLFKMDKETSDDGSMEIKRPKRFPLAYLQWVSLGSLYISSLLMFLLFV